LVQDNPHLRRYGFKQASRGVVEDRTNLIKRNTGKPFGKLRDLRTIFEVFEECRYRHASPAEYPCAADAPWISLDGEA
jgi:hypothetical protein